ncbi:hypothetical protein GE09DRAFT_620878 [Coniochaeta sp. 2T2.1]|nr:hypothetical protein GE09DRAFT_620878 [Coniochaeta sp. 2T2.1]
MAPTTTPHRPAVILLSLTFLLGLTSIYVHAHRIGYGDALLRIREKGPPYYFPSASTAEQPIRTWYTGIPPLDRVLTLATIMFYPITDGSAPQLSVYGFHFAGQFLGVLAVVGVEALRRGNRGNSFRFYSIWGSAMQLLGYGVIMPLYGIVHLLTSPVSAAANEQQTQIANLEELEALPLALVIAYIMPAVLMSIPVLSDSTRQWFGAVWQGVPIWSTVCLKMIAAYLRRNKRGGFSASGNDRGRERRLLARVYGFAFAACLVGQLVPLGLILTARVCPSVFPAGVADVMTIWDVFVPPPFWTGKKMKDMASGIHGFFQYDQYVGSLAAGIWAVALYIKAMGPLGMREWMRLAALVAGLGVVAGPIGVVVWLIWCREEKLLSELEVGEARKRR